MRRGWGAGAPAEAQHGSVQPAVQPQELSAASFTLTPGAQQPSPRHASRPSLTATAAMTSPAIGSAQYQPKVALRTSPTSRTADMYVHSNVWVESATTAFEPSARPVRRCAQDRNGMITREAHARTMPTVEASGYHTVARAPPGP